MPNLPLLGSDDAPPRRRGHGPIRLALAIAACGVLASTVWLAIGDTLPGGRWFAVHLFTLGVLSPLVLALSQHFAATLTRLDEGATITLTLAFITGAVGVLVAVPSGTRWLLVTGATIASAAVFTGYLRLRRHRRDATGARFGWVVRIYERAHGSFLHGAVLGALLGAGLLPGQWYLPGRVAHLHANVLGWGVLTLLATVVFFGPTILRRQIEPGADEWTARRLRHGATGVSIAVLALLASGVGGPAGTGFRLLAAGGVATLAWVGTGTCLPIIRTALGGSPSAGRWPIAGACAWLSMALWADVLVVAFGAWRWLDALGAAALLGVLLQAIVAAVIHLAPVALGRGRAHRDAMRDRIDRLSGTRAAVFDVGVVLLVATTAARPLLGSDPITGATGRVGWALVAVAVLSLPWVVLTTRVPDEG